MFSADEHLAIDEGERSAYRIIEHVQRKPFEFGVVGKNQGAAVQGGHVDTAARRDRGGIDVIDARKATGRSGFSPCARLDTG